MLYRETRNEQHYNESRRASNRVKTEVRKAVQDFEIQIAREAEANPKAFYKYTRSKMKTSSNMVTGSGHLSSQASTIKEQEET